MTVASPAAWTTEEVKLSGLALRIRKAGTGSPLLLLHHDIGTLDRLPFYDALIERFTVYLPSHPGYDGSERPGWMRSVRDMAVLYQGLIASLELSQVTLVGLGFGGWIAAEMATMSPPAFRRVGAWGQGCASRVRRGVRTVPARQPARRGGEGWPLRGHGAARSAREAHQRIRRRIVRRGGPQGPIRSRRPACISCTSPSSRCRRIPLPPARTSAPPPSCFRTSTSIRWRGAGSTTSTSSTISSRKRWASTASC